mgnify:CR=1 FL=1
MNIGLPDALNFDKQIPLDGNCRQEVNVSDDSFHPEGAVFRN